MIAIGSEVTKKSGKDFENGEKVAIVQGFTTMTFPCSNSRYAREKGEKTERAAILEGCEHPVRLSVLVRGVFKKWPSIENSYRQKFIDQFLDEFPELADETFVICEKLHGSNLQVYFEPGKPWRVGKRTSFLAEGEKFFGIRAVLPEYVSVFKECQVWTDATGLTMRLFGELVGPGIQKGVDYGDKKRIYFFGYMIADQLQSFGNFMLFAIMHRFRKHLVPRVIYIDGLANALGVDTSFVSELNPVEGNICEGVVIQPRNKVYVSHSGPHFLLKKKNEKFMEKAKEKKPPSPGDPEVMRLNAEFRLFVTENRLQAVFSKHGEIERPQQIGEYIRLVLADAKEDFLKEHGEAFEKLDKGEQGRVMNAGKIVADMLKGYL